MHRRYNLMPENIKPYKLAKYGGFGREIFQSFMSSKSAVVAKTSKLPYPAIARSTFLVTPVAISAVSETLGSTPTSESIFLVTIAIASSSSNHEHLRHSPNSPEMLSCGLVLCELLHLGRVPCLTGNNHRLLECLPSKHQP